jgi:hypothetical protein
MQSDELVGATLTKHLSRYLDGGLTETKAFIAWFLENIYRLDSIPAADAICDSGNDKGIDAIWVDDLNQSIHIFQSKVSQNAGNHIGDVALKNFVGSLEQFQTEEAVKTVLAGNANVDLKNLLLRQNVSGLVGKGYTVKPVFITNQLPNKDTQDFLSIRPDIDLYDRDRIASEFIDLEIEGGISESFQFDVSYAGLLNIDVGDVASVFTFPAQAIELIGLKGISDGSLFKRNVRYSLGNTAVNKSITSSTRDKKEHFLFPLYHNGITILCDEASFDDSGLTVTIKNYVVVNGAQSISTFFANRNSLTSDLRVFVKIISLEDDRLSRKITVNSNNQNAIKPKDLRSDDDLMLRLSREFEDQKLGLNFEIKRGEKFDNEDDTLSNDEAGRLLLAFDLKQPHSAHQIYRVFDDYYSEIFGRPVVDANRIVFLRGVMKIIQENIKDLSNKPMAAYALTRYFILSVVREIIDRSEKSAPVVRDKAELAKGSDKLLQALKLLIPEVITDLNHLVGEQPEGFDYKRDLKSPEQTKAWRAELLRTHEKDMKRGKATSLDEVLT